MVKKRTSVLHSYAFKALKKCRHRNRSAFFLRDIFKAYFLFFQFFRKSHRIFQFYLKLHKWFEIYHFYLTFGPRKWTCIFNGPICLFFSNFFQFKYFQLFHSILWVFISYKKIRNLIFPLKLNVPWGEFNDWIHDPRGAFEEVDLVSSENFKNPRWNALYNALKNAEVSKTLKIYAVLKHIKDCLHFLEKKKWACDQSML